MAKVIPKITVRCPHCGGEQPEPEQAKSTFCRKCSEYFAITPASFKRGAPPRKPVTAGPRIAAAPAAPREEPSSTWQSGGIAPSARTFRAPGGAHGKSLAPQAGAGSSENEPTGLRHKFEGLFGSKPRTRTAVCFECASGHEVTASAQSTTCRACGAYIDLQDYKISGSFSRNIKTRGTLYLSSKGDLSSSKIVCAQATLHGRMRGNLTCAGKVTIRIHGRLYGSVEAGQLIIEKGSDVVFSRAIRASGVEVHGHMTGQILSDSLVTIFRHGSLDGSVSATGFTVEKGGSFQGELTIAPRTATGEQTAGNASADRPPAASAEVDEYEAGLLGPQENPALG